MAAVGVSGVAAEAVIGWGVCSEVVGWRVLRTGAAGDEVGAEV